MTYSTRRRGALALIQDLVALAAIISLALITPANAQVDTAARGLAAAAYSQAQPQNQVFSGISNLNPASIPHLRKAIATVISGSAASGPIDFISDSTTRGGGATSITNTWPHMLALLVNESGVPVSDSGFFGASNFTTLAAFSAFDPQISGGSGWALGQSSAGGQYLKWPGSLTPTALSFAPLSISGAALPFNQCDLYYISNTTTQTLTIDRSGTAPTSNASVNTTAALSAHKITITWAAAAAGSLNITPASSGSGQAYIFGAYCRNTASPTLEFLNMAWAGSNSADWVSAQFAPAYDPITLIKLTAPVTAFIGHGVNDWNNGTTSGGSIGPTPLTSFQANIGALIACVQASGDVLLTDGPQSNPSDYASIATQQAYVGVLKGLSNADGIPFLDRQVILGGFAAANANGLMYDDRHPNNVGLAQEARAFLKIFNAY